MGVVDDHIHDFALKHMNCLGKIQNSDVLLIYSPIVYGLDALVKEKVENKSSDNSRLTVILDTGGGVIDVVERMVTTIRTFYDEVDFVIPDRAMSAGTVFALSADNIYMNYYSLLGPIDPQIPMDGKLRPALGYLKQYDRILDKASKNELTDADAIMLNKLDLADLYQFEQAREHSVELLEEWLSTYKFKNWVKTEGKKTAVTKKMKQDRAKKIAKMLNETERWHSHGRGIGLLTLTNELKLKINDFGFKDDMAKEISKLHNLITDYTSRTADIGLFVRMFSGGHQ